MRTRYATSLLMLLALVSNASAQQGATLDRVESQLKLGQLVQARALLAQWKKAHPGAQPSSEDGARATYLTARLATRADDAEDAYLTVAISAPSSSPYIAESLLRVGQAEMTKGAARNAVPYLQRLVDNYPTSEFAALGKEWLGRAQAALPDDDARPNRKATGENTSAGAPAGALRFAIQVAAFRDKNGARSVAQNLKKAGFEQVRLVTVPGNELVRVRVGRFASETAASDVLKRLQAAGYKPVVASDLQREKVVRD